MAAHRDAAWVGRVVPSLPPSKPAIPKQSTSRLTKTSFARCFETASANSIALAHSPAPERGPPSPQHSASTHGFSLSSRFHIYRLSSSVLQRRMTALKIQTGRRYSRDRISKMHRTPNASPLSPSRARSVSSTFGERSGEGPSKPFKRCSFLPPQSSGTSPAPRHTPAKWSAQSSVRLACPLTHKPTPHGSPAVSPLRLANTPAPTGLRISAQGQPSLSEATLGMPAHLGSKPSALFFTPRIPAASQRPSAAAGSSPHPRPPHLRNVP